jgi:hypothetical protein
MVTSKIPDTRFITNEYIKQAIMSQDDELTKLNVLLRDTIPEILSSPTLRSRDIEVIVRSKEGKRSDNRLTN